MKEYTSELRLMGSNFQFILVADSAKTGQQLLQECIAEVRRIEKLLTEFDSNSETSLINQHAGISTVQVSPETYQLLQRCVNISKLTQGYFDITTGILKKLYHFRNAVFEMPSQKIITECAEKTGYKNIRLLGNNRVYLEKRGMHIGFGAIGKGYAAHKTRELMQAKRVAGGVINASGDLCAWGVKQDGTQWKAGIANPDHPDQILLWFPLNGMSIATSGDYEQYFEFKGIRYSHNINPRTGRPVAGIKSVSVISPNAELSDALATAAAVMGVNEGLNLINRLPRTHCIMIDSQNKIHCSKKIERTKFSKNFAL